jgi:hypothetical protein
MAKHRGLHEIERDIGKRGSIIINVIKLRCSERLKWSITSKIESMTIIT